MAKDSITQEIRPKLIQRASGGWLAVSSSNCSLSIGVDASSKEEAIELFRSEFSRWLEILSLKDNETLNVPRQL
jgi:hypothetical protein